jgi:general secretion pathway protein G
MPLPGSVSLSERRRRERGFTLLELMVVVAILGLLIALVAPAAINTLSKTKLKIAAQDIARTSEPLEMYKLDVGSYPAGEDGLQALITKPGGADNWSGPYIKGGKLPVDPWGRPFIYRSPSSRSGHDYDLCSYGAHGQPGGSGDDATICND